MANLTPKSHRRLSKICGRHPRPVRRAERTNPDPNPLEPPREPEAPDEPGDFESPFSDDASWDVFIADDEGDPLPEPGDFWDVERQTDN